jgi:hypothetical protein
MGSLQDLFHMLRIRFPSSFTLIVAGFQIKTRFFFLTREVCRSPERKNVSMAPARALPAACRGEVENPPGSGAAGGVPLYGMKKK